jgi:hypothetical protein
MVAPRSVAGASWTLAERLGLARLDEKRALAEAMNMRRCIPSLHDRLWRNGS